MTASTLVSTTLVCPVVGAIAPIAAPAAGAPTNGFINCQNASFGFSGYFKAPASNSGTVTIRSTVIKDSAGTAQQYEAVLAAGDSSQKFNNIDLCTVFVYGSAASQKLNVIGEK